MNVPATRMSLGDYLVLDASGEVKHEYVDGAADAMAGGTIEHGAIAGNVIRHLDSMLRTPPDVSVVCGEVARTDEGLSIVNPIVLVEVLSESTADWDRGGKFAHYRRLASLGCALPLDEIYLKVGSLG